MCLSYSYVVSDACSLRDF